MLLARRRWMGIELRDLVRGELAAFTEGEGPKAVVAGPDLLLSPGAAQALSMALHELATNAARHGALSLPTGRVEIGWAVTAPPGGEPALHLSWSEAGGPRSPRHRPGRDSAPP